MVGEVRAGGRQRRAAIVQILEVKRLDSSGENATPFGSAVYSFDQDLAVRRGLQVVVDLSSFQNACAAFGPKRAP